jgi:hypothetical protein
VDVGAPSRFEPWFPLLGEALERAVTGRLLPSAMAVYERGEVVWFGPIGVGRQGITVAAAQQTPDRSGATTRATRFSGLRKAVNRLPFRTPW